MLEIGALCGSATLTKSAEFVSEYEGTGDWLGFPMVIRMRAEMVDGKWQFSANFYQAPGG